VAKAQQPIEVSERAVSNLAERLFANAWSPNSGYKPEAIAEKCLEAAEAFERARQERAGLRIANTA
jgi:hypothetical protein